MLADMSLQERTGLRVVRLASTRAGFAGNHAYTDRWNLFDRTADYDVVERVTGIAALRR